MPPWTTSASCVARPVRVQKCGWWVLLCRVAGPWSKQLLVLHALSGCINVGGGCCCVGWRDLGQGSYGGSRAYGHAELLSTSAHTGQPLPEDARTCVCAARRGQQGCRKWQQGRCHACAKTGGQAPVSERGALAARRPFQLGEQLICFMASNAPCQIYEVVEGAVLRFDSDTLIM